jgi:general secretion pathway protein L
VYCDPLDEERYQLEWIAIRNEADSLDVKLMPDGALPRLAATVASGAGVNLLQGVFGAKAEYAGMFRPWKYAAMLLLAFALIGVGSKAADYYRLSREEAELKTLFQAEYQQMAPGAPEVLDPQAVINSYRNRGSASDDAPQVFLQSMQYLSLALQKNREASIQAISYRAGVTDVRLTAPDVATLDSIQRMVDESGQFSAAIQSTDQDGDQVNSRIQIRVTGP